MVAGLKGWFGGGKGGSVAAGGASAAAEAAGGATAAAEVPADEGQLEFDPDADDSEEEA